MSANKYIGKEILPIHIKKAVDLIDPYFIEENTGLYITFESTNIFWRNSEIVEPFVVAYHDFEREGPEEGMPLEIIARLKEKGWAYFIWFPFEVAYGDVNQFVLRYAHELQHYKQFINKSLINQPREFLKEWKRKGNTPTIAIENSWREFDSEMASLRIYETLFGAEQFLKYISQIPDLKMRNYYEYLLNFRCQFESWCLSQSV